MGHLEMAGRRRELIGEAGGSHLFGFKIARSGDAETAGEKLIPGLLADQVRFAGQQRLVHFQHALANHHPIYDDLVAGADAHDIAFDQFSRSDDFFSPLPDYRDFRAGDQGNLIQLALGPNLLNGADQRIDQTMPHAGQSIAIAAQGDQGHADGEQDVVEQGKQIGAGNVPIGTARPDIAVSLPSPCFRRVCTSLSVKPSILSSNALLLGDGAG